MKNCDLNEKDIVEFFKKYNCEDFVFLTSDTQCIHARTNNFYLSIFNFCSYISSHPELFDIQTIKNVFYCFFGDK